MNTKNGLVIGVLALAAASLVACGDSGFKGTLASGGSSGGSSSGGVVVPPGPTPSATCGPGSLPETGMQGRVSQADHDSGKAAAGFTCNTQLVGKYITPNAIGTVGGFKVERYVDAAGHDCAYYDSTLLFPTNTADANAGVNVLDMSDPTKPTFVTRLTSPAVLTPHESLVVSKEKGVLAAVAGNPGAYPGIVDVYDISADCRSPQLKSTLPIGTLGHESGMAPDGKTFISSSPGSPTLTPIDISNQTLPVPLGVYSIQSHGLTISEDGNRAYIASGDNRGLVILDISEIQARKANPQIHELGSVKWDNITIPQNAIPFTRNGKPYVMEIDEYSSNSNDGSVTAHGSVVGAGRIIDISDEKKPFVISNLRLAVHEPENRATIANDPGAQNPTGGYAGHYCNIPTRVNPDIVACSMILSGLRIFDIRDPAHPREVAYYNAPVQPRVVTVPAPASDWAMSSPSFVPERKEIWYTDGYSGFYAVRVTNGAW